MVVFQTAKMVRVVSAVVEVVISAVAAPPRVRLQPPKVYPDRVVVVVLDNEPVDTWNESEGVRLACSVAGTDVAKVFPSKTMVGEVAEVALADKGMVVSPVMASNPVAKRATTFLDIVFAAALNAYDI